MQYGLSKNKPRSRVPNIGVIHHSKLGFLLDHLHYHRFVMLCYVLLLGFLRCSIVLREPLFCSPLQDSDGVAAFSKRWRLPVTKFDLTSPRMYSSCLTSKSLLG